MSVAGHVKALQLPLDSIVVIGSGLLDVLGLRESADVDLVVTSSVFRKLGQDASYAKGVAHGEVFLEKDVYEIWQTWGEGDEGSLDTLWREGVTIDGVRFVSPECLIAWKRRRGLEKDLRDIELLEESLQHGRGE